MAEELEVQVPFERKRDDGDIAAAIVDRLAWNVSVPRDSVKVGVEAGWVTLTGDVDWNYQRKAAEQDVVEAQFNLGLLYAEGDGVPKDPDQAREEAAAGPRWFT